MIRSAIQRPVAVLMFCIGFVTLGVISYQRIHLELMPPIESNELTIVTEYRGAGVEEVETEVSGQLERSVATLSGLTRIRSVSKRGLSEVHLRFGPGVRWPELLSNLRDRIDSTALPEGVIKPAIRRAGASQLPFIRLAFVPREGEEMGSLYDSLLESFVRPLERLPGVALVAAADPPRRVVEINFRADAVANLGLSLKDVSHQIRELGKKQSAGAVQVDGQPGDLKIVTGEASLPSILNITLKKERDGRQTKVSDVASVRRDYRQREAFTRVDGKPAIWLEIWKDPEANAVDVSRSVHGFLDAVRGSAGNAFSYTVLEDDGKKISAAVENVESSVLQGAALAAICVYMLVQSGWPTFVITIVIPLSLMLTLVGMYLMGVTFNLMSLSGLALGIGMMVDSSMVVLESIVAEEQEHPDRFHAALVGTGKVLGAISGSTLATIAVFVPLAFVGGEIGQMFRDVAWTVSLCLLSSLAVSLTVIPTLCAIDRGGISVPKPSAPPAEIPLAAFEAYWRVSDLGGGARARLLAAGTALMQAGARWTWVWRMWSKCFQRILYKVELRARREISEAGPRWIVLVHPFLKTSTTMLCACENYFRLRAPGWIAGPRSAVILIAAVTGAGLLALVFKGAVLFPDDAAAVQVYRWSTDSRSGGDSSLIQKVEKELAARKDVLWIAQRSLGPTLNEGELRIRSRGDFSRRLEHEIDRKLLAIPGLELRRMSTGIVRSGPPFQIEVYSEDLADLRMRAAEVEAIVSARKGMIGVQNPLAKSDSELLLKLDPRKLGYYEVEPAALAQSLRSQLMGEEAGIILDRGIESAVRLGMTESGEVRRGPANLDGFWVNQQGRRLYLASVGKVERRIVPSAIEHEDKKRVARISADLEGLDLSSASAGVTKDLRNLWRGKRVEWAMGGQEAERRETQKRLIQAVSISIFLIFLLLAAQFESLRQPVLILVTVPLCAFGVGVLLYLTGQPLSALVLVGVVILVGSSVNSSIVLVDFANQLLREGRSAKDAIIESSIRRMRPIIVTTATNILGLIPMLLASGEGSALQKPIAATLIGGLISSTAFCFVLVPIGYVWIEQVRARAES